MAKSADHTEATTRFTADSAVLHCINKMLSLLPPMNCTCAGVMADVSCNTIHPEQTVLEPLYALPHSCTRLVLAARENMALGW